MTVLETFNLRKKIQMSVKRSFLNSVNEKLRFGSGIMQRVTVSVFCKKNAKMTILETFNLWLVKTKNDRKNCIFGFSQKITPDVSTTFTSFTTFICSPPLDFLSHALTENFRDVYPLTELRGPVCEIFDKCQFVGKRQKIKGRAIKRFLFG